MFPKAEAHPALRGFDVLRRLGAGGVGDVFLAKSKGGRLVAIKVLAERGHGDTDGLAREASLCVRLVHPAIVQVRAFLEDDGFAALVFDYVPGVALARLLRFCASHGVRLPDPAAWHVTERVLAALTYAHSLKDAAGLPTPIVHRDVSPANVLVDWNGGVKLADFGIAKMIGVSPATTLGLVKGTLGCMAPEQARGDRVTERADVYAAALLAWRLSTGRVPFAKYSKDEIELMRAMRNPRIKPLSVLRPDLPEPLLAAIARALEPEAEQRAITAQELAEVVRASMDVDAGRLELAELLARWKPALERTVKREAASDVDTTGDRVEHTLRYEEVALAFDEDDDELVDAPTFEAHALPSDAAILATLPIDPDALAERASTPTPEPPPPPQRAPSSAPPPPPARIDLVPLPRPPRVPSPLPAHASNVATVPRSSPRPRPAIRALVLLAIVAALGLALIVLASMLRASR